jgi:hypothetical protein
MNTGWATGLLTGHLTALGTGGQEHIGFYTGTLLGAMAADMEAQIKNNAVGLTG